MIYSPCSVRSKGDGYKGGRLNGEILQSYIQQTFNVDFWRDEINVIYLGDKKCTIPGEPKILDCLLDWVHIRGKWLAHFFVPFAGIIPLAWFNSLAVISIKKRPVGLFLPTST